MISFLAMIKKECILYYGTPFGWLYHGIFLLLHSLLFSFSHTLTGNPQCAQFWGNAAILQILLIPIVTMKTFSDEYKLGTDQLFYTTGISRYTVVVAKFLVALGVYSISTLLVLFYMIIVAQYGNIAIGELIVSTIGALCAGGSYIAIGILISSLSPSHTSAAVITSLVLLLNWLATFIVPFIPLDAIFSFSILALFTPLLFFSYKLFTWKRVYGLGLSILYLVVLVMIFLLQEQVFIGLIHKILMSISIVVRQQQFVLGIIELHTLLFFFASMFLFVDLTVVMLDRRRWKR